VFALTLSYTVHAVVAAFWTKIAPYAVSAIFPPAPGGDPSPTISSRASVTMAVLLLVDATLLSAELC
jgi:hypothetical protein